MENLKAIQTISTALDLEYLILGGAFLGSGGGGPISAGEEIKDDILSYQKAIQVIQPRDLSGEPNAYGAVVAFMGSPEAGSHGIDCNTPTNAFNALAQVSPNRSLDYAMLIELGAGNSLVPLSVAVRLGIPVVDADGAGRAVPKIQDTTYALVASPSPAALSNGQRTGYPTIDNIIDMKDVAQEEMGDALENYCLGILEIPAFGKMGGLATYLINGPTVSQATIPQTLTLSYYVGQLIYNSVQAGINPVYKVMTFLSEFGMYCYTFGEATITKITQPTQKSQEDGGGLDLGTVQLVDGQGRTMIIQYENENLFATVDGKIWAMAPDLICYLTQTGPMSNVEIAVGQKVTIMGISANGKMRQQAITDSFMADLQALGVYSGPYIPIEQLHQ